MVRPRAALNKLQSLIPSLLGDLESRGINKVFDSDHNALKRLRIESCSSTEPTQMHPPGFYLHPNVVTTMVGDGNAVVEFCESFLAGNLGTSKVDKLRRAKAADERHVVIVLTTDELGPHVAVATGELPTRAPNLPHGIEWLWVIAPSSTPMRSIYWSPAGQWSHALIS
jgi:hypothetical protein